MTTPKHDAVGEILDKYVAYKFRREDEMAVGFYGDEINKAQAKHDLLELVRKAVPVRMDYSSFSDSRGIYPSEENHRKRVYVDARNQAIQDTLANLERMFNGEGKT